MCGIDASAEMLARAETKARKAGESVEFRRAFVQSLPIRDAEFDCVLATVMMHHLPRKARVECATEVLRSPKAGWTIPRGRVRCIEQPAWSSSPLSSSWAREVRRKIVALLGDADFEISRCERTGFRNLHYVLAAKKAVVNLTRAQSMPAVNSSRHLRRFARMAAALAVANVAHNAAAQDDHMGPANMPMAQHLPSSAPPPQNDKMDDMPGMSTPVPPPSSETSQSPVNRPPQNA